MRPERVRREFRGSQSVAPEVEIEYRAASRSVCSNPGARVDFDATKGVTEVMCDGKVYSAYKAL
jgi:hypothetical protein